MQQPSLFRRNPARPSALTIYNVVLGALDAPTAAVMEQDRTFYLGVIKDALEAKYGPPKAPPLVYFASGTNNPSEMEGFALAGQDTGIAVWGKGKRGGRPVWTRTCSGPCFEKIKELGLRFPERRFFMDSGAFSEVDAKDVFKVVLPYTDEMWEQTFARYRDVADALGSRAYPVMPDRIANEMVTLQRLRKYKDQIADLQNRGASVISVLQSPDLVSAYDNVTNIIGPDFIAGIPMKKAPASTEAIVELVQSRPLKGIHLLGIGVQNPRADAILSAIRQAAPSLPITMDSVLIKGAVGRKKTKAGKLPALTGAQDRARRFLGEGGEGLPATSGGAPTAQYQGVHEALREAGIDWTDMISEPSQYTTREQREEIANLLGWNAWGRKMFSAPDTADDMGDVFMHEVADDGDDYGDMAISEHPAYQEALENALGDHLRSDGIIKGAAKLLAAKEVVPEVMAKGGAETLEKYGKLPIEELPNAIPFGPKEIVPNDVIWVGNKSKLYVVYKTGVITLKEDALSPYTRKLMAEKGEEVPILYATALSGGDKGSIVRVFGGKLADLSGRPQTTYFEVPIFYGAPKSVKKRYDAYVKYMTDAGNESLIVPLVESNAKPVEPDAPIPESDASWWDADVRLTHSVDKGTLIEWEDGKEHEQFDAIKAIIKGPGKAFQWSSRHQMWYRPKSIGLLETRVQVGRLVDELHGLGLTVHLDLEKSEDVAAAVARKQEHQQQRAAMYSERAEKLRTKAGTQADYAQQKAKEAITKMKIPGYFPTPDELAYKMATVAELQPGMEVLEPSAGHGALVDAIQRRVRSVGGGEDPRPAIVDAMEISADLRGLLKEQGIPVVSFDIMRPNDYPIGTYYDRVIMNPPFEKGQSINHVLKAYGYVKPGGILVALMPESIMYRKDKKHELFRDWLEMEDAQIFDIEPQKFGRSGEIKTRIIKVKKPRDAKMVVAAGKALTRQKAARDEARISGGALQASREATRGIPMGQPILRGHHSERRHRKAVEKADRAMAKARELTERARTAEDRARSLERTTVGAVDVTKGGRTAARLAPKGYATKKRLSKSPFGLTAAKIKGLVGAKSAKAEWGIAPYRAEWRLAWPHPEWRNADNYNSRYTVLYVNIQQQGSYRTYGLVPGNDWDVTVTDTLSHYARGNDPKKVHGEIPNGVSTDEAALIVADTIMQRLPPQIGPVGEKKREALRRKLAKAKTRQNPARDWIEHTPTLPWTTHGAFFDERKGWTENRQNMHDIWIEEMIGGKPSASKGVRPQAILMMGGPASGKSSALRELDLEGFAVLDSDWVKTQIPQYSEARAADARDAAFSVHAESSDVVSRAFIEARKNRLNIVMDGTGKSVDKYLRYIDALKRAGYDVKIVFVHVDGETAWARAKKRAEETGRWVPEEIVRGAYGKIPYNLGTYAQKADSFIMFDSHNFPVTRIAQRKQGGELEIFDGVLFDNYLRDYPQKDGYKINPRRQPSVDTDSEAFLWRLERALSTLPEDDEFETGLD